MMSDLVSLLSARLPLQWLLESAGCAIPGVPIKLAGVAGSLRAIVPAMLHLQAGRQIFVVAHDSLGAEHICDDLRLLLNQDDVALLKGFRRSTQGSQEDQRSLEGVAALRSMLAGVGKVVVTDPLALLLRFSRPADLQERALTVRVGQTTELSECVQWLVRMGFEKKDFVEDHGDFSVRGGILDIFSFVGDHPLRIELAGDAVESLREFDALSQRSVRELAAATVVPNLLAERGQPGSGEAPATLFDFLEESALVVVEDYEVVKQTVVNEVDRHGAHGIHWEDLENLLSLFPQLHIVSLQHDGKDVVDLGGRSQPSFNGSVKMLRADLAALLEQGWRVVICCDTQSELARLRELLAEVDVPEGTSAVLEGGDHAFDAEAVEFVLHSLHEGFALPHAKLALYTEHQVFNRLKRIRQRRPRLRGFTQKELHRLRKGDFVVHVDYGIGRFDGLQKIRVADVDQEVVKLTYEENDILYVNLHYITKIQKYSSREGHVPKLTRLGSAEWDKLKSRAKRRIKDIARDLIQLYARRKATPGFPFGVDAPWQKELEASFSYEDTYDQARSTREIKEDMEAPYPMDRLVCGDVGFGKTEVAVRATFKCVLNGKQVAVLVPTTILALQHYNTFVDRLGRYSVNVQVLSRFKSKKEQVNIIEDMKRGRIDVIIGTHRLLSRDVALKDLGLLVIDEEHRFGVAAKEKLRQLRATVDTLTLTATPIPRTLHFSLLGARDLSIIATPPRNRLPVITEITQFSNDLIVEAVRRELHRDGQVYFVHDRVQSIGDAAGHLQALLPGVRIRIAHGQMRAHELEEVMLEFLEKKVNVLVCTKIIESGLDLPNVNTIIINRADRFGMAELYQLRGRVGRSNQQAYAYLLIPPLETLPRTTIQRLQALEEFTELGSGFNLAMRDLEIRGAGNLLGAEQSGFIETMGFETYTRVLEEAVNELKEQEFQDLFQSKTAVTGSAEDVLIEVEFPALIPDSYVENTGERLEIYRRLYGVQSLEQLREVALELEDRFGRHPVELVNLLRVIEIRHAATKISARKIKIGRESLAVDFPPETDARFYDHESFQQLMSYLARHGDRQLQLQRTDAGLRLLCRLKLLEADPLQHALRFLADLAKEAGTGQAHAPEPAR